MLLIEEYKMENPDFHSKEVLNVCMNPQMETIQRQFSLFIPLSLFPSSSITTNAFSQYLVPGTRCYGYRREPSRQGTIQANVCLQVVYLPEGRETID